MTSPEQAIVDSYFSEDGEEVVGNEQCFWAITDLMNRRVNGCKFRANYPVVSEDGTVEVRWVVVDDGELVASGTVYGVDHHQLITNLATLMGFGAWCDA